ncbi:Long-chain acyl-CoA synthetase (AMP-forming) [Marinobacter gudaonensis]|uniref:Long-chain acyl-CoA synthetase (AMP-forming) n=1 Tax=Marinobacter gudaonensis TaxID=375760 RepID=A0A1I6H5P3_9GAMM|nr:AMP-binding protein [Marinobacter gudaonensis]SFR49748.1 Long-chain acyl-CoA synthetase (AMP-forming) [Marinobacter gudaonensis]
MATLPDLLARQAGTHPSRTALQGPEAAFTYAQMMQAAQALADQLTRSGVRRAGLCGDNTMAWVLADLACMLAGVVCVPVPVFFSPSQTAHLTERAGLDCLLSAEASDGGEHLGYGVWLTRLPEARGEAWMHEQTAKITFTSGSTGTPKGVCLSIAQMTATTLALKERLAGVSLEHHLCILPLATLLENIAGVYLPLLMGGTVTVAPLHSLGMTGSSGLDVKRLVEAINHHRPHSLILVPELAQALVAAAEQQQLSGDGFRFLAVGGGRVSPDLLARGRAVGLPLYEGYGLSECGSVVALNVPGAEREGSVGQPLGHVRVRVDDRGHIRVAGNTHLGYLGDRVVEDGWLDTGDLGASHSDGFLSVNGRAKNLLITSFGRNISPEWLETELIQALSARQAVVYGDGDPHPSALLVVQDDRSTDALGAQLASLNERLPDYARLARVHVRRLPLTHADGYLTANGRPMRQRIQADLPTLVAGACSLTIDPNHSSHLPGGSFMAFFDRLQSETAEARAHVTGAPVITAIREGRFDLDGYTWFLTQAYHHVKHTVPLMMACGGRLPERLEFVRKALVEYIEEEYGHHEWILNDLAACGEDKEAIRHGTPDTSIELMVAYLYDRINRGNPAAFFGMVQVLEGTSIELATPLGEAIQKQLKLPNQAFSYLYSHGALDQEHFEFFRNLMNSITDPDDQQAIIEAARMVYRLYGDMLHSIPLPARRKEQSHAVA